MEECNSTGFAAKLSQVYTWLSSLMGSYDKLIELNDSKEEIINAADTIEDATLAYMQSAWESAASKMTADSYASEPYNVYVKQYTSNGDGTFTATDTAEYSALHWATVANQIAVGDIINDASASAVTTYSSQKIEEISSLLISSVVEDETPQLGGQLDGAGNAMVDVWYKQLADVTVSSGTHTIYFQYGNRQKITAGGSFALAFGGISANQNIFVIEAVNWGAYTITFPASLKVDNSELPAFSASGTDLIAIEVDKNGTYALAVVAQNIGVLAV